MLATLVQRLRYFNKLKQIIINCQFQLGTSPDRMAQVSKIQHYYLNNDYNLFVYHSFSGRSRLATVVNSWMRKVRRQAVIEGYYKFGYIRIRDISRCQMGSALRGLGLSYGSDFECDLNFRRMSSANSSKALLGSWYWQYGHFETHLWNSHWKLYCKTKSCIRLASILFSFQKDKRDTF